MTNADMMKILADLPPTGRFVVQLVAGSGGVLWFEDLEVCPADDDKGGITINGLTLITVTLVDAGS